MSDEKDFDRFKDLPVYEDPGVAQPGPNAVWGPMYSFSDYLKRVIDAKADGKPYFESPDTLKGEWIPEEDDE